MIAKASVTAVQYAAAKWENLVMNCLGSRVQVRLLCMTAYMCLLDVKVKYSHPCRTSLTWSPACPLKSFGVLESRGIAKYPNVRLTYQAYQTFLALCLLG